MSSGSEFSGTTHLSCDPCFNCDRDAVVLFTCPTPTCPGASSGGRTCRFMLCATCMQNPPTQKKKTPLAHSAQDGPKNTQSKTLLNGNNNNNNPSSFRNGTWLDDAIEAILGGSLSVEVFPPLHAVWHNGALVALHGNRRLFIFRVLSSCVFCEHAIYDAFLQAIGWPCSEVLMTWWSLACLRLSKKKEKMLRLVAAV